MNRNQVPAWLRRVVTAVLALAILGGLARSSALASPTGTSSIWLPIVMNRWPAPIYLPMVSRDWPLLPKVDLSVNRVEIIQGITMSAPYRVQVANRPAFVRVFVSLTGAGSQTGVTGRLTRYVGGVPQDALTAGPITVQSVTNEGNLAQTINFGLPPSWLAPGTAYSVEVDWDHSVPESNEGNNRYPSGGEQSFDFQNAPALDIVIVPVRYARPGRPVTNPPTADLSYLTWMPIKVYPVSQINYSLHAPYTFSGDLSLNDGSGWESLLHDITTIHSIEDLSEHKVYFGLVDSVLADGCSGGCIAGIGWVNGPPGGNPGFLSKSSAGFAGFAGDRNQASPVFTHEMGHNFGRYHSPCGTSSGLGFYPYANAIIGQWGYDTATGQLFDPAANRDYMSYCGPEWTSDFTYQAVFNAWSWVSNPFGALSAADESDALVISGYRDAAGQLHVGPVREQTVPTQSFGQAGPLSLELLDGGGKLLSAQPFAFHPMHVDQNGAGGYLDGFRVAVPLSAGAAGLRIRDQQRVLFERIAAGAAPVFSGQGQWSASAQSARLDWTLVSGNAGVSYNIRFSPDDGLSWTVLGLDQPAPTYEVPQALLAGASKPLVEVQASDGVRTSTQKFSVPAALIVSP